MHLPSMLCVLGSTFLGESRIARGALRATRRGSDALVVARCHPERSRALFSFARFVRGARDGERNLSWIGNVGGRYIEERFLGCVCRRLCRKRDKRKRKAGRLRSE